MKIIFDGFIGQLDAEKERIDEFEDIKRNFKNWNAKKKKKKTDNSGNGEQLQKV